MTFYLSDGAKNIPKDFDTMVCAGMGADTIISILEGAPWLKSEQYRLVLQCQSRRPELRKYLYANGWRIEEETLAEDGKFIYPVLLAVYHPTQPLTPGGYHISPALLMGNDPLLPAFYRRVIDGLQSTVNGLSHTGGNKYEHYKAVLEELLELEDLINDNRS
jgi:tRNA (adenine22-N1)-methyltransferase